MRRVLLLGLLAAALSVTGCLRDPVPLDLDDTAVTVHSLLVTGSDSALVLVTRSTDPLRGSSRGSDLVWSPPFEGVTGAEVRIIAGTDTTWLVETSGLPCTGSWGGPADQGVGCYRASLPAPVLSGATYSLDIRLPDGTRVAGETVAPEAVTISAPAPDLRVTVTCRDSENCYGESIPVPPYTIPVATLPVAWDHLPPSVASTHLALRPTTVYLDGAVYPGEACGLGYDPRFASGQFRFRAGDDTWVIPNIGCHSDFPELQPARFDSIRAEFVVLGLNETYVRYLTSGGGEGVRTEAASHGIEGAYGVFGALSRVTRSITLVRDPPPLSTPESTP